MSGFSATGEDFFSSSQRLGKPIPLDEHAVSVSLPTWNDVVGYEEGEERVVQAMKMGYPRFKIHAAIQALHDHFLSKRRKEFEEEATPLSCFLWPSSAVAQRFMAFMCAPVSYEEGAVLVESCLPLDLQAAPVGFHGLVVVFFPLVHYAKAKAYWQHTGEIPSSRIAEDALLHLGLESCSVTKLHSHTARVHCSSEISRRGDFHSSPEEAVRSRILDVLQEPPLESAVTLTLSGMASIYSALRLVLALDSDVSIVVFGFPYLDTLKMMKRGELNPGGVHFFGHGDANDLSLLRELLEHPRGSRVGAVFTEFPSNPLLKCHDLTALSSLATQFNFLLVVDDTIGSFANFDFFSGAASVDVLCTSLTKVFSGRGDVLAGSLVINSRGRRAAELRTAVASLDIPSLYFSDACILERNSRTYVERCHKMSQNARALSDFLLSQTSLKVFFPERDEVTKYVRSGAEGRGFVLSLVLPSIAASSTFYDALHIFKGPSLGTNFSLCCPYTLLAHYTEKQWAMSYGVSEKLIRISVGMEDPVSLLQDVRRALIASRNCSYFRILSKLFSSCRVAAIIIEHLYLF